MTVRVLHIEDSPQDAWLLERTLRTEGWDPRVHVISSMNDLLRQIENPWDVVLADFGLPGLSTAEALAFVRLHRPDLPFIVVSGQIGEENAVALMKAGADDYVSKAYPQRLSPVLTRVLAERKSRQVQRENEQRHRELENRFRQFFHQNLSGMAMVSASGTIQEINAALLELLGLTSESLPSFWTLFSSPSQAQMIQEKLEQGRSFGPETVEMLRPDGKHAFLLSTYQLPGTDALIWANFIDRTEQRQMQEQIFQMRKLESLGQMAGGIAHEFNNILAVCQGHLTLLEKEIEAASPAQHRIEVLTRATVRGASIVKQLLILARRRPLRREFLEVGELINETLRMLEGVLPENLILRAEIEPGLPLVRGDRDQLGQALLNLVINARDVLPEGGTVVLRARLVSEEAKTDWIRLEVADQGPGVPPELVEKIFDPFFTTKDEGKGTGLGLSLVAGAAQSHWGRAGYEPNTPRGSLFFLLLPPVSAPEAAAPPSLPVPRVRPPSGTRVLVVENEEAISEFEASILQTQGYEVLRCTSGAQAWARLQAPAEPIALVLTDLGLAGMTGESLCALVRTLTDPPAVVVQSGNLEPEARYRLAALGVAEFLSKPFTADELIAALESAFQKRGGTR